MALVLAKGMKGHMSTIRFQKSNFPITYNFHHREVLLLRKTEVEENSNQGMVDRVKMRTGDTGETLVNINSLTTIYFSSNVPVKKQSCISQGLHAASRQQGGGNWG